MANFKTGLGSNIKLLRKLRNITQEELAEIIGIHSRQLSKIETGDHFPSCKTLEKICIALDVSPKEIFDFEFLVEETQALLTGTGNAPVFRVEKNRAEGMDNVCFLNTSVNDFDVVMPSSSDESMLNTAKALNKPVFVEYFEDGKSSKIVVFYPDGKEKVIKNSIDVEAKQNMIYMMKEFKKISKNKNSVKFIKLALTALNDDESLSQLVNIIEGMKLARGLD